MEGEATSDSSQLFSGSSDLLLFCVLNHCAWCFTWFEPSSLSLKMRIDIFHAFATHAKLDVDMGGCSLTSVKYR